MATRTERGPLDPRPAIAGLEEYDPPESAERLAKRLGIRPADVAKLDANENPYGPPPSLARLLADGRYHEYIDPQQETVRAALAEYVGVPPEYLLLGNGSDEVIDLLMRAYLDPGDEVLTFPPTFGMYAFNAEQYAALVVEVERDERFDIPLAAALAAVGPRTRLIFVTAPNNPTGNQAPLETVEALLGTGRIVVLDEAYAEFAGRSLATWVPERENLVVLRTFSKWAALAGLRAGYGVLPPRIAAELWKLKQPFNLNVAAEIGVLAALRDKDWLLANVAQLVAERERITNGLAEIPYLRPYPSVSNFVLCAVAGRDAGQIKRALAERGILIRTYRGKRLENAIRITVGRPQDTERVLAALIEL